MKTDTDEKTLASHWNGPVMADDSTATDTGKPVSCIATTYTFDAAFFEADLLPRFLGLRFDNTEREASFLIEREQALGTARAFVLVDHTCVDAKQTTLRWDQIPVRVGGGAQHAKIVVLAWEHLMRVIVSSANLTKTGYRTNREIAGVFDFFDGGQSAPLQLAKDTLDFLHDLAGTPWVQGNDEARSRLNVMLEFARKRLERWKSAPADFTPRELPRVTFVGGRPAAGDRRLLSVLGQVGDLWGGRRATDVAVMTPFAGETQRGMERLIERLKDMSRRSNTSTNTYLAIPGHLGQDGGRMISELPAFFRDVWNSTWGEIQEGPLIFVVPPARKGEKVNRALHAKALSLTDGERDLLLCGSSNFTPHGMGEGVANIEANLCFQDSADVRVRLDARLPVRWYESEDGNDFCAKIFWPDKTESPADEKPRQPAVPAVFKAISYNEKLGKLTVFFDAAQALPAEWSLTRPGKEGDATLLNHLSAPALPPGGNIPIELPANQRSQILTGVLILWTDAEGQRQSGWLPVQVDSLDNLLPPEEFRGLTADHIMNCLISGREPAELVGDEDEDPSHSGSNSDWSKVYDPLREIDTTGYTLYQVRKLGQTLAALAERLQKTVRITEATNYRLYHDPLGPVALADALSKDLKGDGEGATADPMRDSQLAFSLAEIALTLAHVCRRVQADRNPGDHDVRPVYREVVGVLLGRINGAGIGGGGTGSLDGYIGAVRGKCSELLGAGG
jgi:hypothetical protein